MPRSNAQSPSPRKPLNRWLERDLIRRVPYAEYRSKVRSVYAGPQGAFLATASFLSLHTPLGEQLFSMRRFDLRGARRILDVGSGAGQLASHLLKFADPHAEIICSDLSPEMLRRARQRLQSRRPVYLAADLTRLPFATASFDCITCGYVLEHLPEPRVGLTELARVLKPGGRMLLLTTEDSFGGAMTSYFWYCRTYNRGELLELCQECGLLLKQELWYSPMHKLLRAGGICVELVRDEAAGT
jgi:ubiquinone/menaquinone biosynthesis C-methylase UbiE